MNVDRARRALARLMRGAEGEIDAAAREAAVALEGATNAEILALIKEAALKMGERIAADLVRRLSASIGLGARAGFAVMGQGDRAAAAWIDDHREAILDRFSSVVAPPRAVIRRGLAEVQSAIRAGESAQEAAYRMRDIAHMEPSPAVAQLATRTAAAARKAVLAAGPAAQDRFGVEVLRLERYARSLGSDMQRAEGFSMRGATLETAARMRDAVERMRPDLVAEAAKWHVYHKVAYHERSTARTEMSRAYNGTFAQSAKSLGADRMRWVLNHVRHVPDICDVRAREHSRGCPAGVYLVTDLPEMPAHPNDMCYWEFVED